MKTKAVLIYKSYMTYFQSALPVYIYGMPDGSIYIIYTRFYEINFNNTGLEFVFAELEDFKIDFESGQLFLRKYIKISLNYFKEKIDQPEPRLRIIKAHRNMESYSEAQAYLNKLASKMTDSRVA
jgi:hypothetical protein